MLLDIFVDLPLLVMTEIAWCIRVATAVACLALLFALAIGMIGVLYRGRANVDCRKPNHANPEARFAPIQPASDPSQQFVGRDVAERVSAPKAGTAFLCQRESTHMRMLFRVCRDEREGRCPNRRSPIITFTP